MAWVELSEVLRNFGLVALSIVAVVIARGQLLRSRRRDALDVLAKAAELLAGKSAAQRQLGIDLLEALSADTQLGELAQRTLRAHIDASAAEEGDRE